MAEIQNSQDPAISTLYDKKCKYTDDVCALQTECFLMHFLLKFPNEKFLSSKHSISKSNLQFPPAININAVTIRVFISQHKPGQ